ncbi:MAG: SUF system NifU family Fe-S cluster assembly protein [Candidatus Omnitrophica bacterium]|nr:SUF system NifU family Fe-S cluster assembly protein [Candidatus Omnitrophota bacterium]
MSGLRDLYQEVILDHNKKPRNFGKIDKANHCAHGDNPLCGDKITVYLLVKDGIIEDIKFEGSGCAISTASSSLMTTLLKGKSVEEAATLFETFHNVVTGNAEISENLGKLAVFGGVREFPSRVKCATLAWHTLRAALENQEDPVSTE